jgi:hypothetical protein
LANFDHAPRQPSGAPALAVLGIALRLDGAFFRLWHHIPTRLLQNGRAPIPWRPASNTVSISAFTRNSLISFVSHHHRIIAHGASYRTTNRYWITMHPHASSSSTGPHQQSAAEICASGSVTGCRHQLPMFLIEALIHHLHPDILYGKAGGICSSSRTSSPPAHHTVTNADGIRDPSPT